MDNQAVKKTRVRKSREDRIAEILAVATAIFINEGYSELTLRRVAKDVGIRLSTVQYYFESKDELLDSLLRARIDSYRTSLARFKEDAEGNSEQLLSSYILYLLSVADEKETCGFFTQLWAMGFQNDVSRGQLAYMYETHREDLAMLIQAIIPVLSKLECLKRATIISSMIEGSLIHMGYGLPRKPEFEGVRERMHAQIMAIALEPLE